MASRDANIARTAVEAIWHSVCHAATQASQDSKLMEGLRLAVRQCFERQPKHAGYVRCLQSFALADRGGGVDVTHAAQAAKASDSLQAGALQVSVCQACWSGGFVCDTSWLKPWYVAHTLCPSCTARHSSHCVNTAADRCHLFTGLYARTPSQV
jgi:hypothetical protein